MVGSGSIGTVFDLQRFVGVQDGLYERACQELATGRKRSHWMWFEFPQMRGLGNSVAAVLLGIVTLAVAPDLASQNQ